MKKVRWGILSTAKIGTVKVIPAMQRSEYCDIVAIASRDRAKATSAASQLGIPKAYGSYEELLADPEIDAIYNPLPNHLHVPFSVKALQAGKHVLCEKPVGLTSEEVKQLMDVSAQYPELKIMEAFMYRHHPQWQKTKALVKEGAVGELKTIHSFFSYFNVDPGNIRNKADIGGGGMMDIGCYCISLARFIFGKNPARVAALVDYDPVLKTDRLASGMMDFESGTSTFTCSTQLVPYQRVIIFGTTGRIEIEIPFNAPPDKPCRIFVAGSEETKEVFFDVCDQYTIQGDLFSRAVINQTPVPVPLEDAFENMRVLEAILQSGRDGVWISAK